MNFLDLLQPDPYAVPVTGIALGRLARWVRRVIPVAPRVYIAAPEGLATHAQGIGATLTGAGFVVCSRWHDVIGTEPHTTSPTVLRDRLHVNLVDLATADLMVLWSATGTPRTTYIEAGWAQMLGVPILWVQGLTGARTLGDHGPGVEVTLDDRLESLPAAARSLLARVRILPL